MNSPTIRRIFIALALSVVLFGFLPAVYAQQKTVSVLAAVSPVNTESQFATIREALKETLKINGFSEGKQFRFQYEIVDANLQLADAALLKLSRARPDLIVVMSAQDLATELTIPLQAPVLQVRLTQPNSVMPLTSWTAANLPVTGVTNFLALSRRVALIRQLVPGARKVGVIYNPAHAQTVARVKELQEVLTAQSMSMIEAGVQRPADVGSAARSLLARVDVFYSIDDEVLQKAYPALVKVANDAKMPLFAQDADHVRQGAVASLVVTDREVGIQAGRMAAKILRGTKSTAITPEIAIKPQLYLNEAAAQKQGVILTDTTLKSAVEVFNQVSQERSSHDRSRR